jgi:hypothetical protein
MGISPDKLFGRGGADAASLDYRRVAVIEIDQGVIKDFALIASAVEAGV